MLENIRPILNFKHSLIAMISLSIATIFNLHFTISWIHSVIILTLCAISSIIVLFYFSKHKALITLFMFLGIGFLSSTYYNLHTRVYPVDDIIHEHRCWISGKIYKINIKEKYSKVYITDSIIYDEIIEQLENNYIPNIVVSTYSSRLKEANVGDEFVAQVLLSKPATKLYEDDFDYSEYLLQNKINLTAQVRGDLYITPPEYGYSIIETILNYRQDIVKKITDSYSSSHDIAGVTIALITGFKGFTPFETKDFFKRSGLAHLMAISGMHMAFVFGMVFFLIRFIICLVPAIALNYSSKKLACVFALIVSFFYLILAGMSLPTIRAFSMVLIFSITIFLNRPRIALHSLCVIAILILIIDPAAILSVSFQLSFGAVFAILIYNMSKHDEIVLDLSKKGQLLQKFSSIINISIIAFCATLSFIAFHFSYISIFAIIANIFASILMTILVMPCLIMYFIGFILLDINIFSSLNYFSIDLLISLAKYFANFENSSVYVNSTYSIFLLFISLTVIAVITLNIYRKYLISLCLLGIAFLIPIKYDFRPKILELYNSNAIGIRQNDKLTLIGNLSKREKENLLNFYRLNLAENNIPKTCDLSGCVYSIYNQKILHMNEGFYPTQEDIILSDYIVTSQP